MNVRYHTHSKVSDIASLYKMWSTSSNFLVPSEYKVQSSLLYLTTGPTNALSILIFVSSVMSDLPY